MKLSIIIPCYNESATLQELLKRVIAVGIDKEIIFVDDGSDDDSTEIAKKFSDQCEMTFVRHDRNRGKGAAVRSGINNASGDIVIIQDADLEYNPQDYHAIVEQFQSENTKVVYGSRNLKNNKCFYPTYKIGGIIISKITNLLYGSNITDEPTCYKAFRRNVISHITFKGNSFEWEPEVTAKLLKAGHTIKEVPIQYFPRSFAEGKKIKAKDGLIAIWTLIKYRFIR